MRTLAAIVLAVPCVAQATWTVNSAGGAQFTAIQPAIAAAAAGDRIAVLGAGPYGSFVVDRGVEVESVVGAICGSIEVLALPAGQRARVSGFVVDHTAGGRVRVVGCAGAVILANVAYTGAAPAGPVAGWPDLFVSGSATVFIDHCDFRGPQASGGYAALIESSQAVFTGCSLLGGSYNASPAQPTIGYAGLRLVGSHATLRGTVARGGTGAPAATGPGGGGDGVHVVSGEALVLGQCQLRGGYGGGSFDGAAARGNVRFMGDTMLVGATIGATLISPRPIVVAPGGVLIGTTLQWQLLGAPGQHVWLGLDLAFGYLPLPQFDSALVVTANAIVQPAVLLDAQGNGTWSLAIPNVAALRHLDVFAQGVAFVNNALVLTAPSVTHTL
jgi:hypothetical protein